ncbi:acyl-CoA thioester hydrolase/BAAT C-terminal domain-containing protein [Terracoccus luteus]|uniref:Alpha-beta hydrolase superfamily lysophospholipase n=1 Tax=Terracoccus luteus TaxID=53356 RepID=A0A839PWW6_9MICO|nr:acyl-CoA thioester hydrolase/BAAT C-terminal domain-containing protein [Terracoccus luteus]MBB2986515.1 alpha-beta hydrolase superfamily lysophospholipase [Terracoccus luteus]MCP2171896.1 alpha-beta hydrolase superfamily lysophospholipase [Terracoccus luteus]
MSVRESRLAEHDTVLAQPVDGGNGTGVLVLGGSSGRVERDRVRVLAQAGVTALGLRWFGGPGLPPAIDEYPLERLSWGIDRLADRCDRIAVIGSSKGAEALLLYSPDDPRVDAVVAFAPTHVAWADLGRRPDEAPRDDRSSWSRGGRPLPFVPYDHEAPTPGDPPAFAPMYAASLAGLADRDPDRLEAARLPVERFFGAMLLAAGGDDAVWPSLGSAREIERRRTASGLPTTVVTHPGAGHRVVLPGETPPTGGQPMARGGTEVDDRALGALVHPHLMRVLDLEP